MNSQRLSLGLLIIGVAGCASTDSPAPFATLECWGTMQEVLGQGRNGARVRLSGVARPGTWGVGALAGLEGEITIVDGAVSLAIPQDGGLVHRQLSHRDRGTLLALATVRGWTRWDLPEVLSLADLEFVLENTVLEAGFDPALAPVPVRIEGSFASLELHVLDGACPLANPGGPPPWRWSGEGVSGVVVGIFAEGQGGLLTHHGRRSHLHAVVRSRDGLKVSGHLDEVALGGGVRLYLPEVGPPQGGVQVVEQGD